MFLRRCRVEGPLPKREASLEGVLWICQDCQQRIGKDGRPLGLDAPSLVLPASKRRYGLCDACGRKRGL